MGGQTRAGAWTRTSAPILKTIAALSLTWSFGVQPLAAQQAGDVIEVPLRISDGRLVVTVAIGGATADFIVSTGNGVTVLTDAFAASHGAGGDFRLGDIPLNMDGMATVPAEQLGAEAGVVGIIGANSLNRFDVLLDVPGGRMLLRTPGRTVAWEGVELSDPIRLRIFHGMVISLDVELAGKPFPAALDTGTPVVVVNAGAGAQIGIESEGTASLLLGARSPTRAAGPTPTMERVPVRLLDLPILERFDPDGNGFVLVGAPIAWSCAVSISWIHSELRTCVR
jgi:hypothetical protein